MRTSTLDLLSGTLEVGYDIETVQCNCIRTSTLELRVFAWIFRTTGLCVLRCGPQASGTSFMRKLILLVVVGFPVSNDKRSNDFLRQHL